MLRLLLALDFFYNMQKSKTKMQVTKQQRKKVTADQYVKLFACWVIFHDFLSSADFYIQNLSFRKISFRNTIRVSNRLDPDQAQRNVGPDLGPNCLQRLSADNTSRQRVY